MAADRVKAARELLGLSQGELAGASGLSQGLISQIERGNRAATESVLRSIARGTGLPWSFFAKTPIAPEVDSLRFRKFKTASPRVTARARRTFVELFDVGVDLMTWARRPANTLPRMDVNTSVDGSEIEDLAALVRSQLGVANDAPIRHLTRALERASIPVAPIVFTDLGEDEVDEVAAIGHFGLSGHLTPMDRSVITYFPSGGDRQRFTLAHELGHVLMHGGTRALPEAELQADRFAGALLIPTESARRELNGRLTLRDYASLKAKWGVSIQALVMRASHLGVLDEDRRVSLFKQISARGWRRVEPVLVKNEEPALLGTLLSRRFDTRPGTYTRASLELGLPPLQLKAMMPQPVAVAPRGNSASVTQIRGA